MASQIFSQMFHFYPELTSSLESNTKIQQKSRSKQLNGCADLDLKQPFIFPSTFLLTGGNVCVLKFGF